MSSATQIRLASQPMQVTLQPTDNQAPPKGLPSKVDMGEAVRIAQLCRQALNDLNTSSLNIDHSKAYTADEILALPLDTHRVDDEMYALPRRRSARHELALAVASLMFPAHHDSLTCIIRYQEDCVRLRAWAALQRRYDMMKATLRNGRTIHGMPEGATPSPVWSSRILKQGLWNPDTKPISLDGVPAVPMPVRVAMEADLAPFFDHLQHGGTHADIGDAGVELDGGKGEPYYGVKAAEFRKGVVYEDGRMDLCKMVVGPDHIWQLMNALRSNHFVQHFLLGNNIIGPSGARAIADFINELPDRMDTWYLAGNCIDGPSLTILVDALVNSAAVTDIWLKRNPLGGNAWRDLFRLITETKNLRTLDLDQTELSNDGVANLFNALAEYEGSEGGVLPLRNLYMNGNGVSIEGARAIASFLKSPHCSLEALYLSNNPLGDVGVQRLAEALPRTPCLARLLLQSVGASTQGVIALCEKATQCAPLRTLDVGQAFATEDLGQAYNYVSAAAIPAIAALLESTTTHLEYLSLGQCPMTPQALAELAPAVLASKSLLFYNAIPILPDISSPPPTFIPSKDLTLPDVGARPRWQIELKATLYNHLTANIKSKYGDDMTFAEFREREKRWLVSPLDVRKIDSVYRNRDAGMARRGLLTLVKDWEDGDDTLQRIQLGEHPVMA